MFTNKKRSIIKLLTWLFIFITALCLVNLILVLADYLSSGQQVEETHLVESIAAMAAVSAATGICIHQKIKIDKASRVRMTCMTEGRILEIIKGGEKGFGGEITDTSPVYSYTVDGHSYIVKPLVIWKNCELNQTYKDSAETTCITYSAPRLARNQTRYREGDLLEIQYDPANPADHFIINDKDRIFQNKSHVRPDIQKL